MVAVYCRLHSTVVACASLSARLEPKPQPPHCNPSDKQTQSQGLDEPAFLAAADSPLMVGGGIPVSMTSGLSFEVFREFSAQTRNPETLKPQNSKTLRAFLNKGP